MDRVLDTLSSYTVALQYEDLARELVHHVKRRLIDTLGCAIGCYDSEPPQIARAHALEVHASPGATVLGTKHRTAPEHAAFANGVMARYFDFNDTSIAGNAGHPSDNIMPILATAEYGQRDVRGTLAAIVAAYEAHAALGRACKTLRANGWENAVYVGLATAAGAAKALGLDKEKTAHAIALTAVANAPMMQTRVGHLSMWKGCTSPNAARNGVFAALMARRGMTGPLEAFEGPRGFKKQLGTVLELPPMGGAGVPFAVAYDKYKSFPADYEAQSSLGPALALHKRLGGRLQDIQKIEIETYDHAIVISADNPAKWRPDNRETADHSLPYVFAVGLARGTLWLDDFELERIRDPGVRALMQKIEVRATPECNRDWPEAYPFRVTVTLSSGETMVEEAKYSKGHPKNPLSDAEIEEKFRRLAQPVLGERRSAAALARMWEVEKLASVSELLSLFELPQA